MAARWRIEAIGGGDEPFGNLTITITAAGEVSIRLPRLAGAPSGTLGAAGMSCPPWPRSPCAENGMADPDYQWQARLLRDYTQARTRRRLPHRVSTIKPGTLGTSAVAPNSAVRAAGPVVGVDLNDGHLAVRRLDPHGNPVGRPERIEYRLTGRSNRRDAQVRHAITRLIRYASDTASPPSRSRTSTSRTHALPAGRPWAAQSRQTVPQDRSRHSDRRLPPTPYRAGSPAGIALWAVNPAYSSTWGDQHWRRPYKNVTRHEAAATVIGRAPGPQGPASGRCDTRATRGSRRESYQPDRTDSPWVNTGSRHRPGTRGTESRPPAERTRLPTGQPLPRKHQSTSNGCTSSRRPRPHRRPRTPGRPTSFHRSRREDRR